MAQKKLWTVRFKKGYDTNRSVFFTKLSLVYKMFTAQQIGISLSSVQKESKGLPSYYISTDVCELRMQPLYSTEAEVVAEPIRLHPSTRTQGGEIARGRHRSQRDKRTKVQPAADE